MALAKPFRPGPLAGLIVALAATSGLASCGRDPAGSTAAPGSSQDRQVATVDGRAIWASEVRDEAIAQGLIAPAEPLNPASPLAARMLDEVIDRRLLAAEAVRRGVEKDPQAQRRLEAARERALGDLLVARTVAQSVNEDTIRAAYQAQLRLAPDQPAQTLDQARPQIVRFLTYDQIRDLLETLRAGAKIEKPKTPSAPAQGGKP